MSNQRTHHRDSMPPHRTCALCATEGELTFVGRAVKVGVYVSSEFEGTLQFRFSDTEWTELVQAVLAAEALERRATLEQAREKVESGELRVLINGRPARPEELVMYTDTGMVTLEPDHDAQPRKVTTITFPGPKR